MEKTELVKLVQKAAEGDAQAFSVLYEEYYDKVYYLCFKLLQNAEEAGDITQESFITAFESIKTLHNAFAFEGWLKTIASNKCKNYFKKAKPLLFSQYESEDVVGSIVKDTKAENAVDIIDNAEVRRIINDIIDRLPDEQRTCVMLYYFEEKSVAEIAEFMECSEGTVKSRLNYARKKIKEEIEAIEKRDNIKLHSAVIIPLLGAILANSIQSEVAHKGFISVLNGTTEVMKTVTDMASPNAGEIQVDSPKSEASSIETTKNSVSSAKKTLAQKLFKTTASKVVAAVLSATILVSGGMYAGSRLNSQSASIMHLDSISNVNVSSYSVFEPYEGGFAGVTIEFDPVENADGYEIRYSDDGNSSSYTMERLSKNDTALFFGTQGRISIIDIRPYKILGFGKDTIYGEWCTVYDPHKSYSTGKELNFAEWDAVKAGHTEINY